MQRVGKYQLLRKLAVGGMAEVFLARAEGPMGFQKRLVVKRILPHYVEDPNFVGMFLAEAKLAAELNHPNLVQIFDFGEADGQYYIAMEYIDGPNLRALNRIARSHGQPLGYGVSARIITMAAEGLNAAHELRNAQGELVNLVHRDISPDNVLVSRNGTVKVVDFGIAKVSTEPSRTKSGMIKGKLAYMPPEQLAREPLDRRSDIFALGVVLYELVAGHMPFDATSEVSIIQAIMSEGPLQRVRERQPDVPAELDAIIARCLEKRADDRYPTCKALQAALEQFIASTGQPVFASDLAQLVQDLVPAVSEEATAASSPRGRQPTQLTPLDPSDDGAVDEENGSSTESGTSRTRTEGQERKRPQAEDDEGEGVGPTFVRPSSTPRPAVRRTQLISLFVLVLAVSFVGASLFVFRPWDRAAQPMPKVPLPSVVAPTPLPPAPAPVPAAEPDPTPPKSGDVSPTPASDDQAPEQPVVAKPPEPDVAPEVAPPPPPQPAPVAKGRLELRIRPFANVYLDGKSVGETPLPPLVLSVGKHRLRLVNEELGKNVEHDVVVKPGDNLFKLNLKE